MSFNENHIHPDGINRTNYEEYFLLYTDDELTADEKAAVEKFAAAHPDLKMELDILLTTKLLPEIIDINKEELSAQQMQANEIEQALLLYIDDELPEAEKNEITHQLAANKDYQLPYQLLQKTKPDNSEKIIFPYKRDLYRKPASAYSFTTWLRIAAMVILVLGTALFIWMQQKNAPSAPVVQHRMAPVNNFNKQKVLEHNQQPVQLKQETALQTAPAEKEAVARHITDTNAAKTKHAINKEQPDPVTASQNNIAVATKKESNRNVSVHLIDIVTPSQLITNTFAVTSAPPLTYITTEASATATVTEDATAGNNSKNKTPLKGLLRKATRFIERTTNINPVNDNGDLLVGVVSLKVK